MREAIEIELTIYASIQDLGRYGYRALGVPVSGALDRLSAVYANALVGNNPREAVIEIIGGNFIFKALRDIIIAITGANAKIVIDGSEVEMWRPIWIKKNSRVEIMPPNRGQVIYLAIAGGIDVGIVMGSKSTYYRAGFGGYGGRLLKPGDIIASKLIDLDELWNEVAGKTVSDKVRDRIPRPDTVISIRTTRGIHADLIEEELPKLYSSVYTVRQDSDRMGYRLEGPVIEKAKSLGRLISSATDRGYVQIPPDGKPIILMADAQTTGGYAVALHVVPRDIDTVAQCAPGYQIRFINIDPVEAERDTKEYLEELENPSIVEEEIWSEYY